MRRFWLCVVLLASYQTAFGAGAYEGRLLEVWVNSEGLEDVGWIRSAGPIQGGACSNSEWLVADITKPSVKMALSFALAALAADREVRLYGTGTCYGQYEFLNVVAVK